MKTIFKYHLMVQDNQYVYLPKGAHVLHLAVDEQTQMPAIWAYVDTYQQPIPHHIQVIGTGMEVPDGLEHLGTVQAMGLVWHFFDAGAV